MHRQDRSYDLTQEFLHTLGFSADEAKLYLCLATDGQATLLEAARRSGIERTKLYRIIDDLIERKIIEEIPTYKRRTIKACGLQTLELLIKEQELKTAQLKQNLPLFSNALQSLTKTLPENNVIYYHGVEGIRQMTWNILRTKGVYRTYSYRYWEDILGKNFVLKLNEEMVRRGFEEVHDLYSDQYLQYKSDWLKIHKKKPEGDWSFWDARYIPEDVLTIDQNLDVYNNVVAYYYWEGDETFGVEIINERVAKFQKQMHDVLWGMSKKRPELDWTQNWS